MTVSRMTIEEWRITPESYYGVNDTKQNDTRQNDIQKNGPQQNKVQYQYRAIQKKWTQHNDSQ